MNTTSGTFRQSGSGGASTADPARCLSVVIPCYNEEATIATVIERVLASPFVGEVIVIDDGSKDASVDKVRGIRDPRVRLLVQPKNMGKGAALRRGLVLARLPYVIVQDADLEYDPAEYDILLQPLIEGRADVVYGSRFHTSRPHRVLYFWHSIGNRILTTASNMATNLNLSDMETCYKVFRREVIQNLSIEEDRFGFEPEVTAKVAHADWRIFEVGISYDGRTYAEGKKIGWKDGVRAMYCIGRYGVLPRWLPGGRVPTGAATQRPDAAPMEEPLPLVDGADSHAAWMCDLLAPYLRGDILEVGAARGALTQQLARHGHVIAADATDHGVARLKAAFAGQPQIDVQQGDALTVAPGRSFDTIVLVNVLEHVENDREALERLKARLKPGGHLLVLVPAHAALGGSLTGKRGPGRRYERGRLLATAYQAGLEVIEAKYVNAMGLLGSWVKAKATPLADNRTQRWSARLYDKAVVPWLRKLEGKQGAPVGQSLLLVACAERVTQPEQATDLPTVAQQARRR